MKIAVGTMSVPKLQYLQDVLDEMNVSADLIPVEVESGVSEQPLTAEETKQGSVNRTSYAYSKCKNADMAIGVEVGYHPDDGGNYEIFCYATLIDKNGKQLSAESHRLLLPDFHQNILKENKYLGDHVRKFLDENLDENSKLVGEDLVSRRSFIKASIKAVLTEYFEKNKIPTKR
jgi:non-canonical (house-cleaning) NTP pyrophosphatase